MSSKEITTFVVDVSASMGRRYDLDDTDLSFGLKYFYHSVISKIIRARKTDYISLITCRSPQTNNPFSDGDSFAGIDVVEDKMVPDFASLKKFNQQLVPNVRSKEDQSDCVEAMMVAVGLMQKDAKLKFIRNIVVITNAEDPIKSFDSELFNASISAINALDVNVTLVGVGFDDQGTKSTVKTTNETAWGQLISNYTHGRVLDAARVENIITKNPPLKKVEPRKMYQGALRFGTDATTLQGDENQHIQLDKVLSFNVEVYPAVRPEKLPGMHQYLLSNGKDILKVSTDHQYFIYKDADEDNDNDNDDTETSEKTKEKVIISRNDWTDGYKYSNADLHAVDAELAQTAKLPTNPSIDIIGFIKADNLPVAFFTEESNYVVPAAMSSPKDYIGYDSLCQALMELKTLAIVRYVQKPDDEVKICALNPAKVKVDDKFVYGAQMVRLPFREDEKIGTFPPLIDREVEASEDSKDPELLQMQDFIMSKDLDGGDPLIKQEDEDQEWGQRGSDSTFIIENQKADLKTSQGLGSKADASPTYTDSKLMSANPAIQKFNLNLIKMIKKASEADDLHQVLNDRNFLQTHITSGNGTNLFNLKNILLNDSAISNEDWLSELNKKSTDVQRTLAGNTRAYNPEKSKKRKTDTSSSNIQKGGNYGNDIIDEDFDLEAILAD